jgi:hypothetical protein
VTRPHPTAMPSLAKELEVRVLSDCIVANQEHRTRRDHLVQQERDQYTSQRPRRPSALGKHPMIGRPRPLSLRANGK